MPQMCICGMSHMSCETQRRCYLEFVDHLIKQFPGLRTVGVLKVVLYTNLDHNGLQVTANTFK